MLQILLNLQLQKPQSKQVCSILAELSVFAARHQFFTTYLESPEPPFSHYASGTNETDKDLSSVNFSIIAQSVISKCSHFLDIGNYDKFETLSSPLLKEYFLRLSCMSPEIVRRYWRVSVLKPQDVLEMLLGFDCDSGKYEIELKKIAALWGLFKWASEQIRDFEHLPQSRRIMAKMLVRVGLFEEAECLLSRLDGKGIFMDYHDIFSDLMLGYLNDYDFERAILKYNQMRRLGLVPSFSCYWLLLEFLVQMNETQLAHQIFLDMVQMGMERSLAEKSIHENVVHLLCIEGKVQDARDLVKRFLHFGIKPSNLVLNAIVSGYCKKKDYDDILSLFHEFSVSPNVAVGNKVIYSLSRNFGAERGNLFMQEFEQLGFQPDEVTYGVLIGQSCKEGRLKSAFIYLSEMLSRNLKPPVYSYNALMSGLFKEGMWKQTHDILQEMDDSGIMPNLSTFRVLLAGFCKARQFGKVKEIVGRMADHGLIQSSLLEDWLSIALTLLGLCPLAVKVRRDNDIRFPRTQFFDELGNGLYLDTDPDGFDKNIDKVLDDAMIPDFNFYMLGDYANKDIKNAVGMIDEMARWGQELSLSTFSTLLHGLSASHISIKTISSLLEKTSKSIHQLDQRTLNLLVQKYSKRGLTCRAKMIFDKMIRMQMEIENETYTALLVGLCKKGNLKSLNNSWKLARESNWSPEPKDVKALLDCLCEPKKMHVALELLETFLMKSSYRPLDAIHEFLAKLCSRGFTSAANVLADELSKLGLVDDMIYSFLISGFCKEKKFAEAFMIFDAMVAKNLVPPLDVALQLIPQLCKVGNFEKAFALQEICLKGQPSALHSVSCALLNVLCKWGRIGEASNLFQELLTKENLQDSESYNILLQGYCQVNNFKKAGELLGAMIRKNLGISISSYRRLMQMTCAVGKLSDALGLKELMLRESSLPDLVVYNILIFYLSSAQNTIFMDTVIKELQKKGLHLDRVTYDFILRGASYRKDVSRSLLYLETMISEGLKPSNRSLSAVIVCLCCHGEIEKALALGEEMESRGWLHGSVIQNNLFEALLTRDKLPEAVEYLNRLVAKGLVPENINYDYQIKRLCQNGELEKASDLLNIMLKKGNAPDSTSFDYLIQGFFMSRMFDLALDFHAEMLHRNLSPSINTWKVLVLGFSEVGKVAEAERLLNLMVNRGETPSREMYSSVISKYRSLNNLIKATELIQAMQQSGYEPDFETHWSVISNFSNQNNKEDGKKNRGFLSKLLSGIGFARGDQHS